MNPWREILLWSFWLPLSHFYTHLTFFPPAKLLLLTLKANHPFFFLFFMTSTSAETGSAASPSAVLQVPREHHQLSPGACHSLALPERFQRVRLLAGHQLSGTHSHLQGSAQCDLTPVHQGRHFYQFQQNKSNQTTNSNTMLSFLLMVLTRFQTPSWLIESSAEVTGFKLTSLAWWGSGCSGPQKTLVWWFTHTNQCTGRFFRLSTAMRRMTAER